MRMLCLLYSCNRVVLLLKYILHNPLIFCTPSRLVVLVALIAAVHISYGVMVETPMSLSFTNKGGTDCTTELMLQEFYCFYCTLNAVSCFTVCCRFYALTSRLQNPSARIMRSLITVHSSRLHHCFIHMKQMFQIPSNNIHHNYTNVTICIHKISR